MSTSALNRIGVVTSSRAFTDTRIECLHRIHGYDFDIAVWERSLPESVAAFCEHLVTTGADSHFDVTTSPETALHEALSALHAFSSARHNPAATWLIQDIEALASEFAGILDCSHVRLRLTRVADHGCAVFHVDTLPARLLCTYAGKGMQWADEPHIRRSELGLQGREVHEANAAIVPDSSAIHTVPTGSVAVFKGRLWPEGHSRGLVHRSYPVCCSDHARLRLVIDPAGHSY